MASSLATDVWVIYPGKSGARFRAGRNNVRTECMKRGWNYQERPTLPVRVHPEGRYREILSGTNATAIYRRAHRARAAVIVLAKTHVFLHPSQEDAVRQHLIARLQALFQYKCFLQLLDDKTECSREWTSAFADRFQNACLSTGCEDERDARCLPLHVFSNDGKHYLLEAKGRLAFDIQYGGGTRRVDLAGRRWGLFPHAFHGHEQLFIAGTPLPKGFHWDVQPGGESTTIVTTTDVWVVSRYVNIYPDSHVRGDRPHAKRVV